ncbi:MAG: YCF48-related protein, partial [Chloroflexi bacterium]|nr:YCF48-related protein [Chloroflexota bacterium]
LWGDAAGRAGGGGGGGAGSQDGGETWQVRDAGIDVRSLFSLASVEREGGKRLFAGTEPAHLYYSDDMGTTWTELPEVRSVSSVPRWRFAADPFEAHLKHINFHPNDPAHMYVSIEVGGLLESTDDGETWVDIEVPNPDVHRTVIDHRNPSVLWTTGGAGLLLSQDGGASWQELFGKENDIGGYPDQLVHLPSDPATMYVSASQTGPRSWVQDSSAGGFAGGRIARSADGGRSWNVLTGGLPDRLHGNVEAMCLEESRESVQLFAGMTDGEIWWTGDGGDSWSKVAQLASVSKSVHAEMLTGERTHALKFSDGERVGKKS